MYFAIGDKLNNSSPSDLSAWSLQEDDEAVDDDIDVWRTNVVYFTAGGKW